MNRGKLVQFTLFIFALILFICLLFGASHFLYYEFLFQASMLDLLTLTRVMALRNLVAIIFCTVWFVSCWTNVHASDDRNQKLGLLRFTFFLWSAFGMLLFKIHYDFAASIRPVFGTAVTYQFAEYLQRVGLFCVGISLFCYLFSLWLTRIKSMIRSKKQ